MKLTKQKLLILSLFITFHLWLSATTIEVNQDGSGDFTIIQDAINTASYGDSVLVYPGTYYENLVISEANLTLCSLQATTEDDSYIKTTIINGNQSGSCFRVEDCNYIHILGFTIKNGTGYLYGMFDNYYGGGLNIIDSNLKLDNCFINDNSADFGGGLITKNSNVELKGNIIKNNHANNYGGGGCFISDSSIFFDNNTKNSIFSNYAGSGNDIYTTYTIGFLDVVVDTFTVMNPTMYHALSLDIGSLPIENSFNFQIQNAKITPVSADFYVASDGDNNNSGLTPDEPLQDISLALLKIRSDSLTINNVFIENGIYSKSLNNQHLPVHVKGNVTLIGESKQGVIIDAEETSYFFRGNEYADNITIKNFTLKNLGRYYGIKFQMNGYTVLENIDITDCHVQQYELINSLGFYGILRNISIYDCSFHIGMTINPAGDGLIENCRIYNNTRFHNDFSNYYRSIVISSIPNSASTVDIVNSEIVDNIEDFNEWPMGGVALALDSNSFDVPFKVNLVNSTIANNEAAVILGSAIMLDRNVELNIYNSIIYGNTPHQFCLDGRTFANYLNVYNSLIEGGEDGVGQLAGGDNSIDFNDSCLDQNPLWEVSDNHEYFLNSDSPCIDSGTFELPVGVILPEFDLAGNPRVYGSGIDMGAYEWGDSVAVDDNIVDGLCNSQISNYPNPFNPSTLISFTAMDAVDAKIEIYNIKGQKIVTLSAPMQSKYIEGRQTHSVTWNGIDQQNKPVSSGIYFATLVAGDKVLASRKMLLLK